jgi:polar amino acid transport system substrate-binding protein
MISSLFPKTPLLLKFLLLTLVVMFKTVTANDRVEVGVLHFPPFYQVNADDDIQGYIPDEILHPGLKLAGYEDYQISAYPAKRLYENVASGRVHIWCGNKDVPVYNGNVFVDDAPRSSCRYESVFNR